MDSHVWASLCCQMVENVKKAYPNFRGYTLHADKESQYTGTECREKLHNLGMTQNMNSSSGRCHDNARCKNM